MIDTGMLLQYAVDAIVTATSIGAVTFAWRTSNDATRIRTILCEPRIGMVDRMVDQETRLEKAERDIASWSRSRVDIRHADRNR